MFTIKTGSASLVGVCTTILVLGVTNVMSWNRCPSNGWVPYRVDSSPNASQSFLACMDKAEDKPGWNSSHETCRRYGATLAWWTDWKELAFYYHAFQKFKQKLNSVSPYFTVLVNLRDNAYPEEGSYYSIYDYKTATYVDKVWNHNRQTMIRVQHRHYKQAKEIELLNVNCAAFRMAKDRFVDSDIDMVPCNESVYGDVPLFGIPSDLSYFLCRKERAQCPPVTRHTLGDNVTRIEGVYTTYYGTMRRRQQIPNPNLLVNHTVCHFGCDNPTEAEVTYFTGDYLRYWCDHGFRSLPTLQSWQGSYAICNENGEWQYISCAQVPCDTVSCLNYGIPYSAYSDCLCDCKPGWTGERCDTFIPDYTCLSNPCLNGGICMPETSGKGFRCQCKGAVGERCEYELNECTSNPCGDGSLCIDHMNGYTCQCDPFRQGKHCSEVVPFCSRFSEPCKNGAPCYSCNVDTFKKWCEEENRTQFLCNCKRGFGGTDCSVELNVKVDAWEIFSIVLGCMLFVIVSLMCEIIGSRRRHDHDNLQVLLESIDGYLKQHQNTKSVPTKIAKAAKARKAKKRPATTSSLMSSSADQGASGTTSTTVSPSGVDVQLQQKVPSRFDTLEVSKSSEMGRKKSRKRPGKRKSSRKAQGKSKKKLNKMDKLQAPGLQTLLLPSVSSGSALSGEGLNNTNEDSSKKSTSSFASKK